MRFFMMDRRVGSTGRGTRQGGTDRQQTGVDGCRSRMGGAAHPPAGDTRPAGGGQTPSTPTDARGGRLDPVAPSGSTRPRAPTGRLCRTVPPALLRTPPPPRRSPPPPPPQRKRLQPPPLPPLPAPRGRGRQQNGNTPPAVLPRPPNNTHWGGAPPLGREPAGGKNGRAVGVPQSDRLPVGVKRWNGTDGSLQPKREGWGRGGKQARQCQREANRKNLPSHRRRLPLQPSTSLIIEAGHNGEGDLAVPVRGGGGAPDVARDCSRP